MRTEKNRMGGGEVMGLKKMDDEAEGSNAKVELKFKTNQNRMGYGRETWMAKRQRRSWCCVSWWKWFGNWNRPRLQYDLKL